MNFKTTKKSYKGKLSDECFAKMSAGYEAEQAGLADSIQKLSAALSEKKDKTANISRFLNLVKRNLSFEDLPRDVLNTFIQKIVVHEVDKSSGIPKHGNRAVRSYLL